MGISKVLKRLRKNISVKTPKRFYCIELIIPAESG
jgi:hypothetical protein